MRPSCTTRLTLCSYTLPAWASPLKSRNYRGDYELDAKVYSAVTGDKKTQKDLETDRAAHHHAVACRYDTAHERDRPAQQA